MRLQGHDCTAPRAGLEGPGGPGSQAQPRSPTRILSGRQNESEPNRLLGEEGRPLSDAPGAESEDPIDGDAYGRDQNPHGGWKAWLVLDPLTRRPSEFREERRRQSRSNCAECPGGPEMFRQELVTVVSTDTGSTRRDR